MKCPNDDAVLIMSDRQGIEIDYCPQCRGVWLDRGELDKLIERSAQSSQTTTQAPELTQRQAYDERPRQDELPKYDDRSHSNERYPGKKHKKEGFLGDFFDF